jgi:hypothetical protein
MVTDRHIQRLHRLDQQGWLKGQAAARAGIDPKTARKYRQLGQLPSEVRMKHTWRTRLDPFADVWPQVEEQLTLNPGLEAQTLFAWLQRRYPSRFADGQLRTLQRRIKQWRAEHGPAKEVFFSQVHQPGRLAASDFTHCTSLGITINGQPFAHLIYHFVLTYSNWETGTVCFAESFESLSTGLQNALLELGGVPQVHRTDSLTAAVPPGSDRHTFQQRYQGLLQHYGLQGQAINPTRSHENGDVEQSHHQFKRALEQALLLRGSRDFGSRADYEAFVRELFRQRNQGRSQRLKEEVAVLRPLPAQRLDACKRVRVRVDRGSTLHVGGNTYSVASRLIGEWVEVRLHADHLEVWYAQKQVERLPRLRGRGKHRIEYRHVIDWLVRKPGAFADYCYRDDLFPSSRFRLAYDRLLAQQPERASKEYLEILNLAARESESGVEAALERLLNADRRLSAALVLEELRRSDKPLSVTEVVVASVDLAQYDALLDGKEDEDVERTEREGTAGTVLEGPALTDVPGQLRGVGPAGAAGGAQLRALPPGAGATGDAGASGQADRASVAAVAVAVRQELAGVGPQAVAGEGAATGSGAVGGFVCGPARERVGVRERGFGEDASVGGDSPGTGACRPQGAVHDVQLVGARVVDRQARPEIESSAEASGRVRSAGDRRPGLCATESGGNGGVVHAAGGALRTEQRAADEQPPLLAVGEDLQGCDDDRGGDRPPGTSQCDHRVEPAELPSGASEEEQTAR